MLTEYGFVKICKAMEPPVYLPSGFPLIHAAVCMDSARQRIAATQKRTTTWRFQQAKWQDRWSDLDVATFVQS